MDYNEPVEDELRSHMKNGTWELVKRPAHLSDKDIVTSIFVSRIKKEADGQVERYKACVVGGLIRRQRA